jgi:isoleucyl-tRNA synthetase
LYCDDLNSKKRKECIIVLNLILDCLIKWLAPIFVFTTEEIYSLVNKKDESIHEKSFVKIPISWKDIELNDKWKNLYKIKQEANIAIEQKRASKEIGSSLEAEIEIFVNSDDYNLMEGLDLAEYFITSKATKFKNKKKEESTKILVKKSTGTKCPRCWKIIQSKCVRCDQVTKGTSA